MKHKHLGPIEDACPGCMDEANADFRQRERRKTVAGIVLLIAVVIAGMAALSYYLSSNGPHLR